MTGTHADWFRDPGALPIVVACTFLLALAIRVLARILVQHLLRINRRKRSFRYRIPLTSAHPARARVHRGRGAITQPPSLVVRPPVREAPVAGTPQGDVPALADREQP